MTHAPIPPIRHAVDVPVEPARAFEIFTEHMGEWWPREHRIGSSPKVGIGQTFR